MDFKHRSIYCQCEVKNITQRFPKLVVNWLIIGTNQHLVELAWDSTFAILQFYQKNTQIETNYLNILLKLKTTGKLPTICEIGIVFSYKKSILVATYFGCLVTTTSIILRQIALQMLFSIPLAEPQPVKNLLKSTSQVAPFTQNRGEFTLFTSFQFEKLYFYGN